MGLCEQVLFDHDEAIDKGRQLTVQVVSKKAYVLARCSLIRHMSLSQAAVLHPENSDH